MTAVPAIGRERRQDGVGGSAPDVRPADAGDIDLMRALHRAVGYPPRNRNFDRWRYFSGAAGAAPAVIALSGGQAIGFYAAWPVRLRLGDESVSGAQLMDLMTHPDHRGRGLFVTLGRALYDHAASRGCEIVYGFPNDSAYPGHTRRLNMDHTGDIPHWVRPIRPSRLAKVPRAAGPLFDMAAALLPRGRIRGFEIAIGKPSPQALDTLLAEWCDEPDVCRIERSVEWLEWRYATEAEKDFEWVCAYRGGAIAAAGVWGAPNDLWDGATRGRARIGELLGADRGAREAVLATILHRARGRRASVIEMICNVGPVVATLRRAGFLRLRDAPFIVRNLTGRVLGANIHDHAAWRITGGDWDGT